MRYRSRPQRRVVIASLLVAALTALSVLDWHSAFILGPAAMWLAILFAGFRPGERLIERIHENRRRRLSRRPTRIAAPRRESSAVAVLLHRLVTCDLAMRPPPQPALV